MSSMWHLWQLQEEPVFSQKRFSCVRKSLCVLEYRLHAVSPSIFAKKDMRLRHLQSRSIHSGTVGRKTSTRRKEEENDAKETDVAANAEA